MASWITGNFLVGKRTQKAYAIEAKLGFNRREPIHLLQDFANLLAQDHKVTPPIILMASTSLKVTKSGEVGWFQPPDKIHLDQLQGQNKATILHEFTHYLDHLKRGQCPHDTHFQRLHWKNLKQWVNQHKIKKHA